MSLLSIEGLSKNFGALQVLSDLSFGVERGSLHSVVGPNGAGKTTLFNLVSGFVKPTSGKILFNGVELSQFPPQKRVDLGICRSFQVLTLFPKLTVLENVRLGIQARSKKNMRFLTKAFAMGDVMDEAYVILESLGLADKAGKKAGELSHGEQRYLDIGVALAGKGDLLLLDEPTSGLVHDEIPRMGETIKGLTPRLTVMLIEHRIQMVLAISDTITVLDYGRVIAHGTPEVVQANEMVHKAYLGER